MAAHWQGVARKAGYDPNKFTDAKEGEGFSAIIGLKHMKGAVIGDPENCSGARCLKDIPEIGWCYVGASTAFVAFADGRKRRFLLNGIPKTQDRTMNVAGEQIILRPASKTQTIRAHKRRLRPNQAKPREARAAQDGSKSRNRTLAATLRNAS